MNLGVEIIVVNDLFHVFVWDWWGIHEQKLLELLVKWIKQLQTGVA
jgi:hypothetical protein